MSIDLSDIGSISVFLMLRFDLIRLIK